MIIILFLCRLTMFLTQFVDRLYQLMDISGGRLTLPELLDAFGKIAWLAYHNVQYE